MDYEKILEAQRSFNEKYGVNFDIYEFEGAINGFTAFGDTVPADEIYKTKFIIQAKKAFANLVDNKLENGLDLGEMINDFEKMIMDPYREGCDPAYATEPFGGWDAVGYLRSVNNFIRASSPSERCGRMPRSCKASVLRPRSSSCLPSTAMQRVLKLPIRAALSGGRCSIPSASLRRDGRRRTS